VRKLSKGLDARDRPFSPERPGSWQGSSRDLVVNPKRVRLVAEVDNLDGEEEVKVYLRGPGAAQIAKEELQSLNGSNWESDGSDFAYVITQDYPGIIDELIEDFRNLDVSVDIEDGNYSPPDDMARNPKRMRKNSYELSFSPEFFFSEGEPYDHLSDTKRPVSVWAAIEGMRLHDPEQWANLAKEVFGLDNPEYLTSETVMDKIQETNTCGTLSSPVDVYIDPEGYFTVDVYDDVRNSGSDYESNRGRMRRNAEQTRFKGFGVPPEIQIPTFSWRQIGGDMDPGGHGGLIATADGDRIELIEIQPVREYVGDGEAADVGFPFWTREASYDLDDLSLDKKEVKSALQYTGFSEGEQQEYFEEKATPDQRALIIAESLMSYGYAVEEGQGGWSKDIVQFPVEWWGGTTATFAEYCGDEDDEFRRDVLEEDEED
jgi:hypothetical protein